MFIIKKLHPSALHMHGQIQIPHLYIIWKILKNPLVERPIVVGYNWIVTLTSIFVGHFLTENVGEYKITGILQQINFCLCTIDFKSLYSLIPVENVITMTTTTDQECTTRGGIWDNRSRAGYTPRHSR